MSNPESSPGLVPSNPSLRSVHEAMHKAAATARRRAVRTSAAIAASERTQALLADVDEQDPAFDALLGPALQEAERALIYIAGNFAHFTIPGLGDSKRIQLAAGCLHLVLEHGQSIVVLTQDKCFGSALALQRPLHETFWRGLWLRYAATDSQVDDAGRDKFPVKGAILDGLDNTFKRDGSSYMAGSFWKHLCSYTHGGFQQIGARLTADGLKSNYKLLEVMQVLRSAGMIQLATAAEFASMAGDEALARTVLEQLNAYVAPVEPPAARAETHE